MENLVRKLALFLILPAFLVLGFLWFIGNEVRKEAQLVFSQEALLTPLEYLQGGGPRNDSISFGNSLGSGNKTDAPVSNTDKLIAQIGAEYVEGGVISQENAQELITKSLEEAVTNIQVAQGEQYTFSDLALITDASDSVVETYVQKINAIQRELITSDLGNEHTLMRGLLGFAADAKTKAGVIPKLTWSQKQYKQIADALVAIPVPAEIAQQHLEITNAFLALSHAVGLMIASTDDPLLAVPAVQLYSENLLLFSLLN